MCFHLCAVSFVTDVEDILVIMVKRDSPIPGVAHDQQEHVSKNKIACHVLQAPNVRMMMMNYKFVNFCCRLCRLVCWH